jgi:hypothetical protein
MAVFASIAQCKSRPDGMFGRALTALVLLTWCQTGWAHAFRERYELPLPLAYFIAGAGLVVALSFVAVALAVRRAARLPQYSLTLSPWLVRLWVGMLRFVGLGLFFLAVSAGFLGAQGDWDSNPLPVLVWVIWWIGVAFAVALVGNIWTPLDPWRSLGQWLPRSAPLSWPAWLDVWPAVLLFFGFACAELAWSENAVPRKLAVLVVAYSLMTWVGMLLFGPELWREKADPFARFFGLFARFAPFHVHQEAGKSQLILQPFGAGLATENQAALPSLSATAFIVLMLSTVAFDGIGETPFWEDLMGQVSSLFYKAGLVHWMGYHLSDSLIKIIGLALTPIVFSLVYLMTCALMARLSGEDTVQTARRYVLSLVPIAVAYHLAHYLTYLLIQGQMIWPLLSDPFDLGWDLLGGRGLYLDPTAIDTALVWFTALVAIVVGHIASLWLAHRESLRRHDLQSVLRLQIPMALLMVAYTMLSLWILSQPVVAK